MVNFLRWKPMDIEIEIFNPEFLPELALSPD